MADDSVRRIYVFFYGLFMDKAILRQKGCVPAQEHMAWVRGFALRIGQRATLVPDRGNTVYGIVMSLTHEEIDALYAEPSVSLYRAEAVLAQLSCGRQIPALCFNLPSPPGPEEHNPEYAARLKELALGLGFPEEYVESIR